VTRWAGPEYLRSVAWTGARPLVLTERTPTSALDGCHGLLIPGGIDVSPAWYGQERDPRTQRPDEQRDAVELSFILRALDMDLQVLGVCRGSQLLTVAAGGSLHQHVENHVVQKHPVTVSPGSLLGHIEGPPLYVNSLHHQAAADLGYLQAIAVAEDGTVEAVQSPRHTFVLGLQWHPERSLTPRFDREMDAVWELFALGHVRPASERRPLSVQQHHGPLWAQR
jgi:putative glutamine amidotransferase